MLCLYYKHFRKLRQILTDKVVSYFVNEMKKDRIKYKEFYNGYSLYFKEGVCTENDQSIKVSLNSFASGHMSICDHAAFVFALVYFGNY